MRVLVVDDETNIRTSLVKFFALENIETDGAENGFSCQRFLKEKPYDAVLVDLKMPEMDGIEVIKWIRKEGFRMPIVMISAHGEISDAVQALHEGAQDYIMKPFNPEELVIKVKNLVDAYNLQNIIEIKKTSEDRESNLIGESSKMKRIKDLIDRVAPSASTVLITGESGTGKEVVAREIHSLSSVADGPFVPVNIGGVQENLLESELFGHEKGAFTGAIQRKIGYFELAGNGTLFLDEIGDMPLSLQVKILRVLQERKIVRLGSTTSIPVNARIIAATNKDLEKMVSEGTFREDLFYRLNVVRIELPPLRERREDIPLLAAHLLKKYTRKVNRPVNGFTPEALEVLSNHSFYGNIRELENVIERAMIFARGDVITIDDLDLRSSVSKPGQREILSSFEVSESKTLKELEREAIIRALLRHEGNRTRAAEELGISRRSMINKIEEYGLKEY
ncbi:MAG: sigma-54 dependent transcriptional regulator [Sphaerochaetaceae bacterium]|nr:sigma-54 dependent transcriptional regulator [Sphaerochaetaceae bacterium]